MIFEGEYKDDKRTYITSGYIDGECYLQYLIIVKHAEGPFFLYFTFFLGGGVLLRSDTSYPINKMPSFRFLLIQLATLRYGLFYMKETRVSLFGYIMASRRTWFKCCVLVSVLPQERSHAGGISFQKVEAQH